MLVSVPMPAVRRRMCKAHRYVDATEALHDPSAEIMLPFQPRSITAGADAGAGTGAGAGAGTGYITNLMNNDLLTDDCPRHDGIDLL